MKQIKAIGLTLAILFAIGLQTSDAQHTNVESMFKNHINDVVQKVKKTDAPQEKRELLNKSFDNILSAFDKVAKMGVLSEQNLIALNEVKQDITDKKSELNGLNGFPRVSNSELNAFADFVQQDYEQADMKWWVIILSLALLLGPTILLT